MAQPQKRQPVNEICTRPEVRQISKKGNFGEKVLLEANYFKLNSQPNWTLNQYRVDMSLEESTFVGLKKALLREHKNVLGSYLFDGTMLYTCHTLPQPLELNSFKSDKTPVNIKIRLVSTVANGDYHYFQVFNILMRKCLEHLNLSLVGRNFYDPAMGITIDQFKLKLWPGYITSIRQHESGIMMCSEISYKVMRTETVYDILNQCYRRNRSEYKSLFKKSVLEVIVITHYNNRTYKIDDVDFTTTPSHSFAKRDGSDITYATYYKEKYGINIKDMKQPLLVSRAKARDIRAGRAELVYLIPELCYCTGITDSMRKDFNLMKALVDTTRINPIDRINKLMAFHKRLNSKPEINTDLKNWDLQIDKSLVQVPGRIFPKQKIIFGKNVIVEANNAEWDFNKQQAKQMVTSGKLKDWVVIYLSPNKESMQNFIQAVITTSLKMGFEIAKPKVKEIQNDQPDAYSSAIHEVTSRMNPQLVLCIVPNNQVQRYSAIKKKLCIERAVPSQVLLSKTLNHRNLLSVACKVGIQLNCKIGGVPWTVDVKNNLAGLMVVGFDVCHDRSADNKDFGAMVSSLDQNFGRYFSAVTKHSSGEELSNCLLQHLGNAITEFRAANNNWLPKYIIIYRDGVGEGQIPFVYDYEVKQIKKRLEQLYASNQKELKFSFVIVTKRINTRLFANKDNPRPGTVVDDVITDPLKYDFFIVSQSVRHGTVAPTSYNVIEDSTGLSPDMMQLVTYKFCHMYFNFSGTVRVPAPCQYAHKLAFFTSQSLHQPANNKLSRLLYFL